MRTLVVSDLHLGARGARALLEARDPLERLTSALAGTDRLVLLGDVLELREGPLRDALEAATRVLARIGNALAPDREVVLVPGNHDHHLLAPWSERRSAGVPPAPLGLSAAVDWAGGEPLAALIAALGAGGARVLVRYPGVWLGDGVYATHGHYLDCHTTVPVLERLAAGANARVLRRRVDRFASAEDYEAVLGPSYAWIHAIAQARAIPTGAGAPVDASVSLWRALGSGSRDGLRRRATAVAVAAAVRTLGRAGLGPLRGDLSASELRRASLAAFGATLQALSVGCEYAIFGHSHRAGPLPRDAAAEWRAPSGARMLNAGCWVHEPDFIGPDPSSSPYRPGFAVELDAERPPRLVNLLDPSHDPGAEQ